MFLARDPRLYNRNNRKKDTSGYSKICNMGSDNCSKREDKDGIHLHLLLWVRRSMPEIVNTYRYRLFTKNVNNNV